MSTELVKCDTFILAHSELGVKLLIIRSQSESDFDLVKKVAPCHYLDVVYIL